MAKSEGYDLYQVRGAGGLPLRDVALSLTFEDELAPFLTFLRLALEAFPLDEEDFPPIEETSALVEAAPLPPLRLDSFPSAREPFLFDASAVAFRSRSVICAWRSFGLKLCSSIQESLMSNRASSPL